MPSSLKPVIGSYISYHRVPHSTIVATSTKCCIHSTTVGEVHGLQSMSSGSTLQCCSNSLRPNTALQKAALHHMHACAGNAVHPSCKIQLSSKPKTNIQNQQYHPHSPHIATARKVKPGLYFAAQTNLNRHVLSSALPDVGSWHIGGGRSL